MVTPPLAVRVYSKETFWYHDANAVARIALAQQASKRGWMLREIGPAEFTRTELASADVVALVLSSGNAMSDEQRAAFEEFVERGGGVVGVHSATFTEPYWDTMTTIIGAKFRTHPAIQPGVVRVSVEDATTSMLPSRWTRTDEWYSFIGQPANIPGLRVLLEFEEPADYPQDAQMGVHPVAWTKSYGSGRVFYTALGHTVESYSDPLFLEHVSKGIEWAGAAANARRTCN
jgi:type 1 glutamine amidotransferase